MHKIIVVVENLRGNSLLEFSKWGQKLSWFVAGDFRELGNLFCFVFLGAEKGQFDDERKME